MIAEVEDELQGIGRRRDRRPTTHDLLRRLGDLTPAELEARGGHGIERLVAERRAVEVGIAGERRLIAAEHAGAVPRCASAPPHRTGCRGLSWRRSAVRWSRLVARFARRHGPFTADELRGRLGVDVTPACGRWSSAASCWRAGSGPAEQAPSCRPGCAAATAPAHAGGAPAQVEPVDQEALGRFLPAWQGIASDLRGPGRLREVISQLEGVPLPVAAVETDILATRVAVYRPDWLDAACAGGEVVWVGAGEGRVRLYLREDVALLHPPPEPRQHPLLDLLGRSGASFLPRPGGRV